MSLTVTCAIFILKETIPIAYVIDIFDLDLTYLMDPYRTH